MSNTGRSDVCFAAIRLRGEGGRGGLILATGFVVLFFSGESRFDFGLMLKLMADDLGWNWPSLSLAVARFIVVSALALPIIGR